MAAPLSSSARKSQHPAMRRNKAVTNLRTMPYQRDRPSEKVVAGESHEPTTKKSTDPRVTFRRALSSEARGEQGSSVGYDAPAASDLRGIPMARSGLSGLIDDLSFIPPADSSAGHTESTSTGLTHASLHGAVPEQTLVSPPLPRRSTSNTKEQAMVEAVLDSLAMGVETSRGGCGFMEDAWTARHDGDGLALFGVFDGHGGDAAAKLLKETLPGHVTSSKHLRHDTSDAAARRALLEAFTKCERDLAESKTSAGATGAVVLLQSGGRCINIAWLGDCRVVLCRGGHAVSLTSDHRLDSERERARVLSEGGKIVDTHEGGRLDGYLKTARAVGDFEPTAQRKPAGLSATPELKSEALQTEDEFLLIASDGLFDVLPEKDAIRIARAELRAYGDASMCAEKLVRTALARQTEDNVTAMVVRLFKPAPDTDEERQGGACRPVRSFMQLPTTSSFVRVVGGF